MQEPLNFSCSGVNDRREFFDLSRGGIEGYGLLMHNPWVAFPSNAFLAASTAVTTASMPASTSNCLQEATSLAKAFSSHTLWPGSITEAGDRYRSASRNSCKSRPAERVGDPDGQAFEMKWHNAPQLNQRSSKLSESGHHSRVVIHQFGDAEDHFSKALRNIHVKSSEESNASKRPNQQKCLWTLKSSSDDGEVSANASAASLYSESKNIADLAVEKHFEKSLATFHAKQACSSVSAALEMPSSSKASPDSTWTPFSPVSPCTNSIPEGLALPWPTDESSSPSFNPKKKWLAQYGDDENAWDSKADSSNPEQRSRSCPLLQSRLTHSVKSFLNCNAKFESNTNSFSKISRAKEKSSVFFNASPLNRMIGIEVPLHISRMGDDGDVLAVPKLASVNMDPIFSYFTDSIRSVDSTTLPVIAEVGCSSSDVSISSIFQTKPLDALSEAPLTTRQEIRTRFCCELDDAIERNVNAPFWSIRKRTASDVSDLVCLKRSC